MTERFFLDTNVLLYADDANDPAKQDKAVQLIERAFVTQAGVLSTQVLQEYFVNATRKLGVKPEFARESVDHYRMLTTLLIGPEDILAAIDLYRLNSLSLWDSLILQMALKGGCKVLYSEDLQAGQKFAGLKVVNPFA